MPAGCAFSYPRPSAPIRVRDPSVAKTASALPGGPSPHPGLALARGRGWRKERRMNICRLRPRYRRPFGASAASAPHAPRRRLSGCSGGFFTRMNTDERDGRRLWRARRVPAAGGRSGGDGGAGHHRSSPFICVKNTSVVGDPMRRERGMAEEGLGHCKTPYNVRNPGRGPGFVEQGETESRISWVETIMRFGRCLRSLWGRAVRAAVVGQSWMQTCVGMTGVGDGATDRWPVRLQQPMRRERRDAGRCRFGCADRGPRMTGKGDGATGRRPVRRQQPMRRERDDVDPQACRARRGWSACTDHDARSEGPLSYPKTLCAVRTRASGQPRRAGAQA